MKSTAALPYVHVNTHTHQQMHTVCCLDADLTEEVGDFWLLQSRSEGLAGGAVGQVQTGETAGWQTLEEGDNATTTERVQRHHHLSQVAQTCSAHTSLYITPVYTFPRMSVL